jgi:hypothetical protein
MKTYGLVPPRIRSSARFMWLVRCGERCPGSGAIRHNALERSSLGLFLHETPLAGNRLQTVTRAITVPEVVAVNPLVLLLRET